MIKKYICKHKIITSDGDKWYDEKESKHKGKSTAFCFSCALGKTGKHGDM